MKKIVLLAASLLVWVGASAQVGIIGGLTSTETNIETAYANANTINQYHVGLTAKIGLPLGLVLQPSVLYNVKGSSVEDALAGAFRFDTKQGYVEVPVMLQIGTDALGPRLFAFAEPYVSYMVDMQTKQTLTNIVTSVKNEGDWESIGEEDWDGVNRLQYGVGAGVGIELLDNIQITARYFWDMGKLYNGDGSVTNIIVKELAQHMKSQPCSGIKVSLAIFF